MAYSSSRSSRKHKSAPSEAAAIETVLTAIGKGILWLFRQVFSKQGHPPDSSRVAVIQEHWEQVELHALQESTYALAVTEADKALDSALKTLSFPGESFADRLRAAEDRFEAAHYNEIWHAHKLRNQLAHEIGAHVSREQTQKAITTFRKALYKLGILA